MRRVEAWPVPFRLFLIPYGEALVHRYYREGLAHLASLPHVEGVGCQTNLSFPATRWLRELEGAGFPLRKIHLWASYHPEMTTVDAFVRQVHLLRRAGICLCAGAVGDPSRLGVLQALRDALDCEVYLFINAMQGMKRHYTEAEVASLSAIDPLFVYDWTNAPADWKHCLGRTSSCYVDGLGHIKACPRSRTTLGHLYAPADSVTLADVPCRNTRCDCFLAFSNLTTHPLHGVMGEGVFWRIPERRPVAAIVFDVDGTLTDRRGRVPPRYAAALRHLAVRFSLYLCTSLTEELARRRVGTELFSLFRGGVYADGALTVSDGRPECLPVCPLPDDVSARVRTTAHSRGGITYKYTLQPASQADRLWLDSRLAGQPYLMLRHRRLVGLVAPEAGKKAGFLRLCARLKLSPAHVLAVGNEASDAGWLSCTPHSCAVLEADPILRQQVRHVLNPDHLAAFFRSCQEEV